MDVITLGESMVLFTPDSMGLMRHSSSFTRKVAGAESNVAIGLSRLGHQVGWISKVGKDEFGKTILSFIRGEGVDTSHVIEDETRPTGVFFKELTSAHNVQIYYYRNHSAASYMKPEELNEEYIGNSKFLHITGITPALSTDCYSTVMTAIEIAKSRGVKVSFDPNIRKKLWSDKKAKETLLEIACKSDIVMPSVSEAQFLLETNDIQKQGDSLLNKGPSIVIIKNSSKGTYYFTNTEKGFTQNFSVEEVDPVGAGDAFAAGFLSGLLNKFSIKKAVERGNAMGALAVTVSGDVEGLPEEEQLNYFISNSNKDDIIR
ncbi:sugar kinase [Pseudogracilibacillus sp. SO30301A]|uniref:sugar kinase n=1 Tax=Pseudogracilibacillus sp. SO30301A TaxID=3098291 RepID=UPI00300DF5CF